MNETLSVLSDLLGQDDAVDFRTFCESPDFCNNRSIYQYWYDQVSNWPDNCSEVVVDGSIGGGKSYAIGAYYFAWRVYKLFQAGAPQLQLGLPLDSDVYCLYFSVSLTMAQRSGFSTLYSVFKDCKWFQENAPINDNVKRSIIFKDRHFQIDAASDFGHQIGLNVWGFILDEANFRSGVGLGVAEEYSEVTALYQQLLDRQISRFARPDGSTDALAILISSASYQSSFTEQRVQAIKGNPNAVHVTVRKYEVTPERFSPEKFRVFIGSGSTEPCIITSREHELKVLQHANLDGIGAEDSFFLDVPVNLKPQFEANIVLALQNHCGVPTNMSSSFMPNLRFLYESYTDSIVSIFESECLEASTDDDTQLIEYLLPGNIIHPTRPHSLFLDLSVSGDTGALCCYRYDGVQNGVDVHTRVFSLHIIPPAYPAQTRIEKVKQFIVDLSQYLNIVAFGSDQYQCLGPDTLVPTTEGIKKISEIQVGDSLFCKSGVCHVTKTFKYENASTIDLITKRGHKINCTHGHRFSYLKSKARNEGKYHYLTKYDLAYADDMVGKRVDHSIGFMIHHNPIVVNGTLIDAAFAEYIGWMTGDGGISNGEPYLCASPSERDIIFTLENRLHDREVPDYWNSEHKSYNLKLLKGAHRDFLVSYFGDRYAAADKHVPEFIFKSPKSVVDAYLRGLYSADGHCTKEQVVLTSCSYKLLQGVQVLLQTHYGIFTQIVTGKRGYSYDYPNAHPIYHLRTVGSTKRFLEIGFWQEQKNQRLYQTFSVKGKGFADYVVSVMPSDNTVVYDIEVDSEDHTYYLWDMLSHNSTGVRQEVQEELGLEDIRISIDSSDIPHMHWVRGLVDHKIRQPKDEYLEREVQEAVHDLKKHRVYKASKSTDDVMQANVGAYYLSDIFAKGAGTIEGLYGPRINLVGDAALRKMLKTCGYK